MKMLWKSLRLLNETISGAITIAAAFVAAMYWMGNIVVIKMPFVNGIIVHFNFLDRW